MYAGRQAAQPNNTYLSVYSNGYSISCCGSSRFVIYCCSNATYYSGYVGSFTEPYGSTYTGGFNHLVVQRYSYSDSYGGCIRLEGSRYYRYSLSYNPGVYMCNIQDSRGQVQRVNFALYNRGSKCKYVHNTTTLSLLQCHTSAQNTPTIYRFLRSQNSNSVLTLICETRTAPPTEISWQKNGANLTIDGSVVQMTQTVTNRHSSYFTSTLIINDDPDNVVGTYRVIVGNAFGQTTSSTISMQGTCPMLHVCI